MVKQCVATEGVAAEYVRQEILPEFFRNFWVRRMALDRRNYKQLVETTEELAKKVKVPTHSKGTNRTRYSHIRCISSHACSH